MPSKCAQCQARGQVEVSVKFYFCTLGNILAATPHFIFSLPLFLFLGPPSQIHLEAKSLPWGQLRIVPVSDLHSQVSNPISFSQRASWGWDIISLTSRGWRSWGKLPAFKVLRRARKREGSQNSKRDGGGFRDRLWVLYLVNSLLEIRAQLNLRP